MFEGSKWWRKWFQKIAVILFRMADNDRDKSMNGNRFHNLCRRLKYECLLALLLDRWILSFDADVDLVDVVVKETYSKMLNPADGYFTLLTKKIMSLISYCIISGRRLREIKRAL